MMRTEGVNPDAVSLNGNLLSDENQIGPDDRWSYELAEADIEITGIVYRTTIPAKTGPTIRR